MTRTRLAVLVTAFSLAACSGVEVPPDTSPPTSYATSATTTLETTVTSPLPAPTTAPTSVVTTVGSGLSVSPTAPTPPPTSTSPDADFPSLLPITTLEYPDHPRTVADLPPALTGLIEATRKDPDLTLSGPGDLERWFDQWLGWFAVIQANPTTDPGALGDGVLAGTELHEQVHAGLTQRTEAGQRLIGYPFIPHRLVLATFDQDYRDRRLLTVVVEAAAYPSYVIDRSGVVVTVNPGADHTVLIELTLRPDGGNEWLPSRINTVTGSSPPHSSP